MKTIFRYTNIAFLAAAFLVAASTAAFAQDNCGDAAGQLALGDQVREDFKDKSIAGKKKFVGTGKSFLEKYGACEVQKDLADWLKARIPTTETQIKEMEEAEAEAKLVARFNGALDAKNWDEVYVSGKEILAKYPEKFRTVEVVLAALGGEEAFKGNYKYADESIKYSKISIADLEAGKPFKVGDQELIGLSKKDKYNFGFPSRPDAIGWLNLYIGYIMHVNKNDKAGAAPYLYKATQNASSGASKNPVPFELIGGYYFEQLNKIVEQIQAKAKEQSDTDTPEVAQQKVDELKKLVAMSNGTAERAMDAFSRAYTLGNTADYKAKMKKNVTDAYKVRFAKEEGVDAWITTAVAKPFINPMTPIAPISDPEPATTSTGSSTGTPSAAPAKTAPAGPIKPKN